jgi:hypothetical protein
MATFVHADTTSWTITGKVVEKGSNKPLPEAFVGIKELDNITTLTDESGYFSIVLPGPGQYTVVASIFGAEKPDTKLLTLDDKQPTAKVIMYLSTATQLAEVVVNAERNPNRVGKSIMKGDEIRQIPGTSGDPLKALQSLPGVAGNTSGSAPAVRGSGPGDNFYYADSVPIGKLFHFGGISVFNGDLIESFNLYSAAFAPYYDNATGAILDVYLRNPRTDRLGGKVNISLTGADFLLEGPVNENQSFYFAARRSYFDLLVKSVERKGVTLQIPNYSDYQGKYIWNLNADNKLTFHLNGATDSLKLEVAGNSDAALTQPDLAGTISLQDSSATQAIVWDDKLTTSANNKLIVGTRQSQSQNSIAAAGFVQIDTKSAFIREQFRFLPAENHDLTLSGNVNKDDVDLNLDFKNTNCTQFNTGCDLSTAPRVQLQDSIQVMSWATSAQDRWLFAPHFTFIGGVRRSSENYLNKTYTEPRLGLEWEWSEKTLFSAGWGRHNQLPARQEIARNFGNPNLEHIQAEHSVIGVSHKVDNIWSWKIEAYYKKFSGLVVGVNDPNVNYVNAASGTAYGAELLIKKEPVEDLSGWLSLTLAKSERRNDLTGESFRFAYDQPVNITWITEYKLSDNWTMGSKWTYTSGLPYTPITGTNGTYSDGRPIPVYAPVNSGTLPDFHRLDLRFDRHFVFETWKLNLYVEMNNVYFRKNIVGYDYGPNYDKKDPIEAFILPISFGVQGEF